MKQISTFGCLVAKDLRALLSGHAFALVITSQLFAQLATAAPIFRPLPIVIPEPKPALIRLPSPKYGNLQLAVDAVRPGGAIELASGTYYGPVTVDGKRITIRGSGVEMSDVVIRG
jgi:hypothetical protein